MTRYESPHLHTLVEAGNHPDANSILYVPGMGADVYGRVSPLDTQTPIEALLAKFPTHKLGAYAVELSAHDRENLRITEIPLDEQIERLAEVLDSLELKRFHIIGQSVGTLTVVNAVDRLGVEVPSMQLWAPPTFEDDSPAERLASKYTTVDGDFAYMGEDQSYACRGDTVLEVASEYWQRLQEYRIRPALDRLVAQGHDVTAFFASEDHLYNGGVEYYGDLLDEEQMVELPGDSHTFRYPAMQRLLVERSIWAVQRTRTDRHEDEVPELTTGSKEA